MSMDKPQRRRRARPRVQKNVANDRDLARKIASAVGSRIRELRAQQTPQWTTEELARRARLSYRNLLLVEQGAHPPNLTTLLALVRAFELCSVEELLGGDLG